MLRTGYITSLKRVLSRCTVALNILLVLLAIFLLPERLWAAEAEVDPAPAEQMHIAPTDQSEKPNENPEQALKPEPRLLETLDAPREYLSEKVVSYAKNIDEFFGDERYFQEHNKSVIQLDLNQTFTHGGNRLFLFEGKAKLDLPAAQRRFKIMIERNPEKKTVGELKQDQPATVSGAPTNEQYSAALRVENEKEQVKEKESNWHTSAELGAKFQFPLDPFVRSRVSYSLPLEDWRLKISETVFWFSTIGLGQTTQLDVENLLSPPVLFRATSTVTCYKAPQNCDLRQDRNIFHTLSDRAALQYQASVVGVSEPDLKETNYILLLRYRYRLHKNWIYYEVTPQLSFPRTDDFRLNALLLLRLEVLFGAT